MSSMLVTFRNLVETAKQCNGEVRASDADGSDGRLFIQVDARRTRYDRQARAFIGDMIVPTEDSYKIIPSSEIASA